MLRILPYYTVNFGLDVVESFQKPIDFADYTPSAKNKDFAFIRWKNKIIFQDIIGVQAWIGGKPKDYEKFSPGNPKNQTFLYNIEKYIDAVEKFQKNTKKI